MSEDIKRSKDKVRFETSGIADLERALLAAAKETTELQPLMKRIGDIIVNAANPPVRTGRLKSTIRAEATSTAAIIYAGGPVAPYAPIIEYGNPHHNIEPQPYMQEALLKTARQVNTELSNGIAEILKHTQLI